VRKGTCRELTKGEINLGDAQQAQREQTSYMPVGIKEPFASIMARMSAAKPGIKKAHTDLLNERYDLSDRPAQGVAMSRGKPVQEGVRSTRSALKRRASCSACSIS
jgi:hypothetical protein